MVHVVAAIIKKDDSYLLASSHKIVGEFADYYYPPAGHIEEGEDELTALSREIMEELSLEIIKAEKIADTDGDVAGSTVSWYVCQTNHCDYVLDQDELRDAGFFTREQMAQMKIWPATRSFFENYIFKS